MLEPVPTEVAPVMVPATGNATTITVNGTTYTLSQYFDKSRFNNYYDVNAGGYVTVSTNIGDYKTLVLGVDGKVVDIH